MYIDTDILYNDEERILQAKDLINDWEYIKAKKVIDDLLEEDPIHAYGHYLMGHIFDSYYMEYDVALKHYEVAVKIAPDFYEARLSLIILLNRCQFTEKAIAIGIEAVKKSTPYQEGILFQLAIAFEKQKEYKSAIKILDRLRVITVDSTIIEDLDQARERISAKINTQSSAQIPVEVNWKIHFVNHA